jgi:hypothetical protein
MAYEATSIGGVANDEFAPEAIPGLIRQWIGDAAVDNLKGYKLGLRPRGRNRCCGNRYTGEDSCRTHTPNLSNLCGRFSADPALRT